MGIIKANAHQMGISATASQNFTWSIPTTPDGTITMYRGNAGTPIATILSVDVSNNVSFPSGLGTTGQFAQFMLPSAPAGWVIGNGSTIGNVGSGATLASTTTLALFTAWWAYTDAQLPILTSAGGASTRGASAAADWAALKRLTVFDVTGRFARNAGSINGGTFVNGTKYADTFRSHTHTIVQTATFAAPGTAEFNPGGTGGTQSGATGGIETAPVSIGMLGCFKL